MIEIKIEIDQSGGGFAKTNLSQKRWNTTPDEELKAEMIINAIKKLFGME